METVSWCVLYVFQWRNFVDTRFCSSGHHESRTGIVILRAGWARLNHELKHYMAVATVSSWVSEGVVKNIMDDDRLLRNCADY